MSVCISHNGGENTKPTVNCKIEIRDGLKSLPNYFCITFAKTFINGSKTQIERTLLVVIFYFNSGVAGCHFYTLALVNPDYTFCNYFFCVGNGYRITADSRD